MKSDRVKSEKITGLSKLVELFPDFDFHHEEWDNWGYDYSSVVFDD